MPAPDRTQKPKPVPETVIVSPDVAGDGSVTFRLYAPMASEVSVWGEWPGEDVPLTLDEAGVWSVTLGPLAPDLYGYSFTVGGLQMADPENLRLKPMRTPKTSVLEVPGPEPMVHDFTDVPHGTVHLHTYDSKVLGRLRRARVYTPPGYEGGSETYPLLCLLHGHGDNEATWTELGNANLIADNLIALGEAIPAVIVMTDGHAYPPGDRDPWSRQRNIAGLRDDLFAEVLPMVEERYRVASDRRLRAIAGLSMGGGQSMTIGLGNLDRFAWVAGFSSYLGPPGEAIAEALASPDRTNELLELLWIACGEDDFLFDDAQQTHAALDAAGVDHEFLITPGNHSWPIWRRYLAMLMPLLFKGVE